MEKQFGETIAREWRRAGLRACWDPGGDLFLCCIVQIAGISILVLLLTNGRVDTVDVRMGGVEMGGRNTAGSVKMSEAGLEGGVWLWRTGAW